MSDKTLAFTNTIMSLDKKLDKILMKDAIERMGKQGMAVLSIFYLGEEDG